MTEDARFEDGGEQPLRLKASEAADVSVVSALVQDAVFPAAEMVWRAKERRFALLLNRFRWEDLPSAERRNRPVERVQSVFLIENALAVRSQGLKRGAADLVLSLLAVDWIAGEDCAGRVVLTLAGDGVIEIDVEALEIVLKDVTRPYLAPSGKSPDHPV